MSLNSSFPRYWLVSQFLLLKTSPQHDAGTTMLYCRDGIDQVMSGTWFPPDMMLGIQAKEFNLCFIRPENFVSHGLRVLQVPFGRSVEDVQGFDWNATQACSLAPAKTRNGFLLSQHRHATHTHTTKPFFLCKRLTFFASSWNICLVHLSREGWLSCFLLRSGFRLATLPYRPDWWSAAWWLSFWKVLITEQRWSSVRMTIGYLVTSLTKVESRYSVTPTPYP